MHILMNFIWPVFEIYGFHSERRVLNNLIDLKIYVLFANIQN